MKYDYTEKIRVRLPKNRRGYIKNSGETVWVKVKSYVKEAYINKETGSFYWAKLDSKSKLYPNIPIGTLICIGMIGAKRPVAFYGGLEDYNRRCNYDR